MSNRGPGMRSVDLLDLSSVPVYFIDQENLELVEEILVPVCRNDWTWFSYQTGKYLLENDIYDSKTEALEVLLGMVISAKKQVLLTLSAKEQMIIDMLVGPETFDMGLVG